MSVQMYNTVKLSYISYLVTVIFTLKSLYKYGSVYISDVNYTDTINKLFITEEKPIV